MNVKLPEIVHNLKNVKDLNAKQFAEKEYVERTLTAKQETIERNALVLLIFLVMATPAVTQNVLSMMIVQEIRLV